MMSDKMNFEGSFLEAEELCLIANYCMVQLSVDKASIRATQERRTQG